MISLENVYIDFLIYQTVAIKRLQSKVAKVSAHFVLSKRGVIYRMVKEKDIAWHAGISKWGKDINLNSNSIGIEIVNNGEEKYPKKQIIKLVLLIKYLKKKYNIKKENVLGHFHIAPKRKIDPGPLFPWKYLNKAGISNLY
jgi:N-acetylmuramoyl-L-alanine amidase